MQTPKTMKKVAQHTTAEQVKQAIPTERRAFAKLPKDIQDLVHDLDAAHDSKNDIEAAKIVKELNQKGYIAPYSP